MRLLDLKVGAESVEEFVIKLLSIITDNGFRYPKATDYVFLDKIFYIGVCYFG